MKASKFKLSAVVLVLLSVSGWASDKMKANIKIYQAVHIGSTQLPAGDYKLTWTESGSNADVTFSQGKKVIATVAAHITQQPWSFQRYQVYSGPGADDFMKSKRPRRRKGGRPIPTRRDHAPAHREVIEAAESPTP